MLASLLFAFVLSASAGAPRLEELKSRFLAMDELLTLPDDALGSWAILSHGYPGILKLQSATGSYGQTTYSGTIEYDNTPISVLATSYGVEQVTDIKFYTKFGATYITFVRPKAGQTYFGLYGPGYRNINGHFTDNGKAYVFDATKGAHFKNPDFDNTNTPHQLPNPILADGWSLLSNGWPGTFDFDLGGNWGTIQYDNARFPDGTQSNAEEKLCNITWVNRYDAWYVRFYRPTPNQWYFALFETGFNHAHGYFADGNGEYEFAAVRNPPPPPAAPASYSYPPAPAPPAPQPAWITAGDWDVIANGYPGRLNFNTLKIQYENGQLNPAGTALGEENVTGLTIGQRYNGWYVKFTRASQVYYGIFGTDGISLHGSFVGSYDFNAQRYSGYTFKGN